MGFPSSVVATAEAVPGIPRVMAEMDPPYSAAWYSATRRRIAGTVLMV